MTLRTLLVATTSGVANWQLPETFTRRAPDIRVRYNGSMYVVHLPGGPVSHPSIPGLLGIKDVGNE